MTIAACALAGPAEAKYRDGGRATVYHTCDGSTNTTASGERVKFGNVANNTLPFGTWIELVRPRRIYGRRYYRVNDTGGNAFFIDIYMPEYAARRGCGAGFPNPHVTVNVLNRKRDLWHGKPRGGWQSKRVFPWTKIRRWVWKP